MKTMLMTVVALAAASALAAGTNKAAKAVSPAEAKANFAKIYYANTGGRVVKPNSGEGKIVFVNTQRRVAAAKLAEIVGRLKISFAMNIEVRDAASAKLAEFEDLAKRHGGAATFFLVEDGVLPMSLVAYENGWGAVNLAKFAPATDDVQAKRLEAELARTMALTCGVACGMGTAGMMMPVRKSEALDNCELPNERGNQFVTKPVHAYMQNFGVLPLTVTTYRKACAEGWAPEPKDEAQTNLWKRARDTKERGPANALKIKPPSTK